ncbi:hypothetical protein [Mycobacterium sp. DL99]|uniref:hypothetical protein n=1 Tax=Mycobacterium sp. DL99 TaxID=2528957 RepID=UPI00108087BE|nr:hypothetical protein [Mycobacterium sp. DL99]
MSNHDPAIAAAQRAWAAQFPLGPTWDSDSDMGGQEFFSRAAREALKPIRAEFHCLRAKALASNDASFVAGLLLALTRLTPLLYTTEELDR